MTERPYCEPCFEKLPDTVEHWHGPFQATSEPWEECTGCGYELKYVMYYVVKEAEQ